MIWISLRNTFRNKPIPLNHSHLGLSLSKADILLIPTLCAVVSGSHVFLAVVVWSGIFALSSLREVVLIQIQPTYTFLMAFSLMLLSRCILYFLSAIWTIFQMLLNSWNFIVFTGFTRKQDSGGPHFVILEVDFFLF